MSQTLLTFVHISDTHISADPEYGRHYAAHSTQQGAQALVQQINALPFQPDFVLHTGDVAYDPDESAYEAARAILSQIRCPVYYVAGNHDDSAALQRALLGRAEAALPFHYEFEVNGVQIICLDSNGPAEPPRGYVLEEQLDWLEDRCAAPDERPLLVAVHHNALPVAIPWLDDYMRITNGAALGAALARARGRLRGVFFGHVHQNLTIFRDGVLYSSALSSWNQFHAWPGQVDTIADAASTPGFSVVTLTREQTYIRHCHFRVAPDR